MAMTITDFVAKIDWEGGILDAIRYGLHEEDLELDSDPRAQKFAEKYQRVREWYEKLDPLIDDLTVLMDDIRDEDVSEEV